MKTIEISRKTLIFNGFSFSVMAWFGTFWHAFCRKIVVNKVRFIGQRKFKIA